MFLTRPLRVILRHKGQGKWYELREVEMPKGFKIFDYSPKYYGGIICFSGLCVYVMMQAEMYPDSIHARILAALYSLSDVIGNAKKKAMDDGKDYTTNQPATKV